MHINSCKVGPVFIVLALSFSGCVGGGGSQAGAVGGVPSAGRIRVVTTIYPLYEFAREVGGDRVDVRLLLPPGSEAHTYEPKPSDIGRISESDVFVYIGAGMEPWIEDILGGVDGKSLRIVDSSRYVRLLPAEGTDVDAGAVGGQEPHGSYDPHIWLDFENDQMIVKAIEHALSEKDPADGSYFAANADAYNKRLESLDIAFKEGLKDCRARTYINGGHKAFEYLDRRYNLTELAVYGISPDGEASPRRIKELVDAAKGHNLGYVYVEGLVNPKAGEAVAGEIGAKTLSLNAGHNLSPDQLNSGVTFISLMREDLEHLRTGLGCI